MKSKSSINKRIEIIRSGKGAGLYGFLGFLCALTGIGGIIAYALSFRFFDDICDKKYLLRTDPYEINKRRGFYAWACYGNILVGIACTYQWKADIISVLEDRPTKASQNRHIFFKVWWPIVMVVSFFQGLNAVRGF